MAGTIIADYIRADANKISLNVGNTVIASINASGILSNTGSVLINSSGTIEGNNVTYNGSTILSSGRVRSSLQPANSVLQVAQTVKTDTFVTSSTSWVDITGYSVSITPSSTSNKVLVTVSCYLSGMGHFDLKLVRVIGGTSTDLFVGDSGGSRIRSSYHGYRITNYNTTYDGVHATFSYLDSPSSTSAVTYKVQTAVPYSGTYYSTINRQYSEADASYSSYCASSIIAMEVAG